VLQRDSDSRQQRRTGVETDLLAVFVKQRGFTMLIACCTASSCRCVRNHRAARKCRTAEMKLPATRGKRHVIAPRSLRQNAERDTIRDVRRDMREACAVSLPPVSSPMAFCLQEPATERQCRFEAEAGQHAVQWQHGQYVAQMFCSADACLNQGRGKAQGGGASRAATNAARKVKEARLASRQDSYMYSMNHAMPRLYAETVKETRNKLLFSGSEGVPRRLVREKVFFLCLL